MNDPGTEGDHAAVCQSGTAAGEDLAELTMMCMVPACIAYEALCGKHPFGRDIDPRIRGGHFRLARPPGMAAHQYAAIARALAFKRSDRTPSVLRFLAELSGTHRHRVLKVLATALGCAGCGNRRHGLRWAASPGSPGGRSECEPAGQCRRHGDSRLLHVPADGDIAGRTLRTGQRAY